MVTLVLNEGEKSDYLSPHHHLTGSSDYYIPVPAITHKKLPTLE